MDQISALMKSILQGVGTPGLQRDDLGKLCFAEGISENERLKFVAREAVEVGVGIEGEADPTEVLVVVHG